jgi:hypothetical protein
MYKIFLELDTRVKPKEVYLWMTLKATTWVLGDIWEQVGGYFIL